MRKNAAIGILRAPNGKISPISENMGEKWSSFTTKINSNKD